MNLISSGQNKFTYRPWAVVAGETKIIVQILVDNFLIKIHHSIIYLVLKAV